MHQDIPAVYHTQIELFKNGVSFRKITAPCTPENGILQLNDQLEELVSFFEHQAPQKRIIKFVPASGAASRMFKHLMQDDLNTPTADVFFENIEQFAFYPHLEALAQQKGLVLKDADRKKIAALMLNQEGLAFAHIPKGLIPFHKKDAQVFTAFEEHLLEGKMYGQAHGDKIEIHFTIKKEFEAKIAEAVQKGTGALGVEMEISFSEQDPATDTIAVDMENNPVPMPDGKNLTRAGGHGALLQNLNELEADFIFLKNIDNVVVASKIESTVLYKKAIGGLLAKLKVQADKFLVAHLNGDLNLEELRTFLGNHFYLPEEVQKLDLDAMVALLDRPMRVCGMVKNQGEPGGGPFWVQSEAGFATKQIVEKSEIDIADPMQAEHIQNASHFNPVDIVCAPMRFDGTKYDLTDFVDEKAVFISEKSYLGKTIKALELPGLWNGAMAKWNTVFVEVPLETFNPVKTVNDLLRPLHQG